MNWFLAHIFFTLLWAALLGAYDGLTLLSGFILGIGLFKLTLSEPTRSYRMRLYALARFALFYLCEIFQSNLRIAADVVRSQPRLKPGIVAVRVEGLSERSIVLVANLITMTPGTLSLDISEDDRFLYVHCLYSEDPNEVRTAMERDYVGAIAALQSPL